MVEEDIKHVADNSKLDRSPHSPVETREELIDLLSQAAELEHGLYLLVRSLLT
jgi:hypothetical protein